MEHNIQADMREVINTQIVCLYSEVKIIGKTVGTKIEGTRVTATDRDTQSNYS